MSDGVPTSLVEGCRAAVVQANSFKIASVFLNKEKTCYKKVLLNFALRVNRQA